MSSPIVRVRDVRKSFVIPSAGRATVRESVLQPFRSAAVEPLIALDGVSFEMRRGEALGIMGRNGSGKSTLLKLVAGIYTPDEGTVEVNGALTPLLELGVGWNPDLDAVDNVLLIGTVLGLPLPDVKAALDSILAFAEVERFARLPLRHYSSGMAARLAYAVAFRAVREVLVLDEIFAVGDAAFRARCEERFAELRQGGVSIAMVSHDPATIARSCDRALLLERGRVVLFDSAERVAREYEKLLAPPRRVEVPAGPPPRVSVIVPCHELGDFVEEAVDSVLAQTLRCEAIVVDDGSREPRTLLALERLEKRGVRVLRTPHGGPMAARNRGLAEARGELVSFLDADDRLDPTFCAKAAARLDAEPALGFVSCWLRAFGDEEWDWRPDSCDLPRLLGECTVATPSLVRKRLVLEAGGFDESLPEPLDEDWDLWLGLVERGSAGAILPETLYFYRRRAGSLSRRADDPNVQLRARRRLLEKHAASYRRFAFDVFGQREAEAWREARANFGLEHELETRVLPRLARLRGERDALRRALAERRS